MIDLTFEPSLEEYGEKLEQRASLLQSAIQDKLNELEARLLQSIQQKLSGPVLNQRTGNLISSVEMQAAEWVGQVCGGQVGIPDSAPSFPYAIAFEKGGHGPYDIYPRVAAMLSWLDLEDGSRHFSKHVVHPTIEQRSFIAPSVAELEPMFYAELQEVLDVVMGGGTPETSE